MIGLPKPTIPSQAVSTSSIRIIVLSNDKHLNGMLAIDNLNAEKYYNVSIAKLHFESFPLFNPQFSWNPVLTSTYTFIAGRKSVSDYEVSKYIVCQRVCKEIGYKISDTKVCMPWPGIE